MKRSWVLRRKVPMESADRPGIRSISLVWLGGLVLAFLVGVVFLIGFAVPYLRLSAEALTRFAGRELWILAHVGGGTVALAIGPFQLWLGISRWRSSLHRKLGWVYLIVVAISCLAAFYLAVTTEVGWIFGMGLGGLGLAWAITTVLAFVAIRRRHIVQHQEWMIRSYVVTFGFVMFRMFIGVTTALEVGTVLERLTAASWFCWAFPLLITEAMLRRKRVFGYRD